MKELLTNEHHQDYIKTSQGRTKIMKTKMKLPTRRRQKTMRIFRLAGVLGLFWNITVVLSLVGTSRVATIRTISTTTIGVIEDSPTHGLLDTTTVKATANTMHSTTTLFATTQSLEPTESSLARVALVFPSANERFRNLTRAIEYSVVHDEYMDETDEYEEITISSQYFDSFTEKIDGNFGEPRETTGNKNGQPAQDAMPFATSKIPCEGSTASRVSTTRPSRRILGSISLWCYWVARKTRARLEKLLLVLFRKNSQGFSRKDLGGTKRHYALLLASLVQGGSCHLGFDPAVYHRAIVESAHHRTVASLSPSALETKGIHVSALERYALKWAIRKCRQK